MGRSKFPGKPSKHVHKKRVNVLPCNSLQDKIISDHQNNTSGISQNNYSFTNNEQVAISTQITEETKGTDEVPKVVEAQKTIVNNNNVTSQKGSVINLRSAKRTEAKSNSETSELSSENKINSDSLLVKTKSDEESVDSVKIKTKKLESNKSNLRLGNKCRLTNNQYDIKNNENNLKRKNYPISPRKRQNKLSCSTSFRQHNETNSLVGKFVLPTRSLHSSRVIKPNKKFIEDKNPNEPKPCPKKLRTPSPQNKNTTNQSKVPTPIPPPPNPPTPSPAIVPSPTPTTAESSTDLVSIDSQVVSSNASSWSCEKLVLRKARLQLHTQTSESGDGPFSNYSSAPSVNPPGTVTCGVCGAVRFYRFVKQARKFNIYSCESCRKFISKMIKRQSCAKNCSVPALVCHKGQGMCHVPPIVRSQQWKLYRCAYKARCPACWLKMCLRSFQMPLSLKTSLANMLPENMRLSILQSVELSNHKKIDTMTKSFNWKPLIFENNFTRTNIFKTKMEKALEKYNSPFKMDNLINKSEMNSKQKKLRITRMKTRRSSSMNASVPIAQSNVSESAKRQKLELKGPRVKHVCRSASIVLGQPVATFPTESSTEQLILPNSNLPIPSNNKKSEENLKENCDSCTVLNNEVDDSFKNNHQISISKDIKEKDNDNYVTKILTPVCCKAGKYCKNYTNEDKNGDDQEDNKENDDLQLITNENLIKISTDFIDEDDPDYFNNHGYEIISSEQIPVPPVCYSCGSAGKEKMIHCASCCEPYHYFCTENISPLNEMSTNENWQLTWSCKKCSQCFKCKKFDRRKITCRKCQKYYHNECLNPSQIENTLCYNCTNCKNCNEKNITKIIGNNLFCKRCYENFLMDKNCLCDKKFDILDSHEIKFDTNILQCYECQKLFHTNCQDVSENQYELIHLLRIPFQCKNCTINRKNQENFNNVLHKILQKLSKTSTLQKIIKNTPEIFCKCPEEIEPEIQTDEKSIKNDDKKIDSGKKIPIKNMDDSLSKKIDENGKKVGGKGKKMSTTEDKFNYELPRALVEIKSKINLNAYEIITNFFEDLKTLLCVSNEELKNLLGDSLNFFQQCTNLNIIKNEKSLKLLEKIKLAEKETEQPLTKMEKISKIDNFEMENLKIIEKCTEKSLDKNHIDDGLKQSDSVEKIPIPNEIEIEIEIEKDLEKIDIAPKIEYFDKNILLDSRICVLCKIQGDRNPTEEGRLLNSGLNEWIHINCALWSTDTFEQIDGTLKNVENTIKNGKGSQCSKCYENGATLNCTFEKCSQTYHFGCARKNCWFTKNQTIICSTHDTNAQTTTTTTAIEKINDKDFEVNRPIFISKKKINKYVDLQSIKYFLGSLNVLKLGTFYPEVSDTEDAIITTELICTRLFWSTKEPWKIVQYKITTTISAPKVTNSEKYFIVDYSQSKEMIDKQLERIDNWKKEIEEKGNFLKIKKETSKSSLEDNRIVKEVIENMLETICNKEIEENDNDFEIPQNTTDILPPELKDAIFEDLPHDLLDGISMQDIFPKLMYNEDVLMDIKNSDLMTNDTNDFLKDKSDLNEDINLDSDEFLQFKCKKNDFIDNDLWFDTKPEETCNNINLINKIVNPELKRSKSEVFSGIKKFSRNRNHQRSCSLTWSCKLDNSLNKKRKVSSVKNDLSSNLFMVVDGTNEKSMLQELRLPESMMMAVGKTTNLDCMGEFKYRLEENTIISNDKFNKNTVVVPQEIGKENKCNRVWQNRPQTRLLQVDGADDNSSSDQDSDQEDHPEQPVKCDRCQCTYRTQLSYKRHLPTCDFISTSDSESEESSNELNQTIQSEVQLESQATPIPETQTNQETNPIPQIQVTITPKLQTDPSKPEYNISCNIFPTTETSPQMEVISPPKEVPIVNNVISNPITHNVVPSNFVVPQVPQVKNIQANVNVNVIKQVIVKPKPVPIKRAQPTRGRGRNYRSTSTIPQMKRVRNDNNTSVVINQIQNTNGIIMQPQLQNNPTIIIQHMPSPNIVPTYIDTTFQQNNGQNLQFATLVHQNKEPQVFIPQNNMVQGLYQIGGSDMMIPNVITQQVPQQVMGTIIQPRAPIQCGVMGDQLVLGSVPTLETLTVETQPAPVFLTPAPQPVYYGFETIVQNTVMQSQQFLSTTAVPGVLSNSSYSATTTQVFQASKIETPAVVEMSNNGYIIVNQVPQINNQTVHQHAPIHQNCINIVQNRPFTSEIGPQQNSTTDVELPVKIEHVTQNQIYPEVTQRVSIPPLVDTNPTPPMVEVHLPPQPEPQPIQSHQIIHQQQQPQQLVPPVLPPPQQQQQHQHQHQPIQHQPSPPKIQPITPLPNPNPTPTPTQSINLPISPYPSSDNNIPMNIVNPIPQVAPNPPVSRPMNVVLPMQTTQRNNNNSEIKPARSPPSKVVAIEPPDILNRLSETVGKIQETLNNEQGDSVLSSKTNSNENLLKLESASLKLVFQKQSQDGIYKISNKYISKSNMPLQLSPTKVIPNKVNKAIEVVKKKKEKIEKTVEKDLTQVKPEANRSRENKNPHLVYKVQSQDGFDQSSSSLSDLWEKVFDAVQKARVAHNMPLLPKNAFDIVNELQLMGLKSNGLKYIMEQMPGAARCMKYKPGFHKDRKLMESQVEEEISHGAIRCVPHKYNEQPYDMFSWLASKHRKPDYSIQIEPDVTSRRSSVNLPVAMRYRQLKETFKHAVGVYPSNIHGRGLFCLRDIESGEMVIEYAGEVIRSTLTDKREKYYNSKSIGCYMFRIDDNLVIDATMKGNAARFINHSCEPNCYSRVLDILGHKHIIIFALRKIQQGEELTYDYKFPFEEDKIPCTCGSKKCRKYLN